MARVRDAALAVLILIALGFFYLAPGSEALLRSRTDAVMSDGTDPTSLPYMYDQVIRVWKERPTDLFYGAVYQPNGDGDRGVAYWMPQVERWLVVLYSYFFPVEQLSTAFAWSLLVLNGLGMFLLCRYLGWNLLLSYSLAIAWAFNCYTRARAKVHMALAGIFHLPFIFLGLFLVVRGKTYRSVLAAALCFLIAATAAHYYLVTMVFLSPFFLLFLGAQPEMKRKWPAIFKRMAIAVLPALALLAFNRFAPVPPHAQITSDQSMNNEWLASTEISPFLRIYRAYAIDYFGGDISLGDSGDINPLRSRVSEYITSNLNQSNTHERSNGIRWAIWMAFFGALGAAFNARKRKKPELDRNFFYFLIFGVFAFWMSLGSEEPIPVLSPSYWLYSFDHHVRVANRAAVIVHFAMLMIVGFYLSRARFFKWKWTPAIFLVLVLIDYLPVQRMPMAEVQARYNQLQREKGECGPGMLFPYINQWNTPIEYYMLLQKMRGSDCPLVSSIGDKARAIALINKFPPSEQYLLNVDKIHGAAADLVHFANCLPLSWVIFHQATPRAFAIDVCRQLGWQLYDDLTCIGSNRNRGKMAAVEKCL